MPKRGPSSFRNERLHLATSSDKVDMRSPFQRDRDRILYSSAFRRLAEITQVVAANSGYVFHNRLTHSLQVAQVGRRLAEKLIRDNKEHISVLANLDPEVVEAASLAHDLGHPPFGHVIEKQLNELSKEIGGFEGNAQSFRILSRLAFHSPRYGGLNLTRATLSAVLKYPWLRDENALKPKKWGAYASEKADFDFAREGNLSNFDQTSEAFLMDWADDITYSVHDLEDFYRAGRIPLHLLAIPGSGEQEYFINDMKMRHEDNPSVSKRTDDFKGILQDLLFFTFPPMQPYRGTQRQRTGLRSFTGSLIGRYINGVTLELKSGKLYPSVRQEYKDEVFLLKELTWTYVIQSPALATQQLGQRNMVKKLYETYADAALSSRDWKLFPVYYRERLEQADSDAERSRACIDLIAGMTEVQVYRIYSRISGHSTESSLDDPMN